MLGSGGLAYAVCHQVCAIVMNEQSACALSCLCAALVPTVDIQHAAASADVCC